MKKSNNGHNGLLMKKTRKKRNKRTRLLRKKNMKKFSCIAEGLGVQSREKSQRERKSPFRLRRPKKRRLGSLATSQRQ